MKVSDRLFRSWYYLQMGWLVYISIIFSIINFVVITYSFIFSSQPYVNQIFPNLLNFTIFVSIIIFIISTSLGYFHFRFGAKKAENEIGYQVNPYIARRLVNTEMIVKTNLILSKIISEKQISDIEKDKIKLEIGKIKTIINNRSMINKMDLKYIKLESEEN